MTDDVDVLKAMVADLVETYPQRPTLLDEFAGRALAGLMADPNYATVDQYEDGTPMESWQEVTDRVARDAYDLAEAMLRERARRLARDEPLPPPAAPMHSRPGDLLIGPFVPGQAGAPPVRTVGPDGDVRPDPPLPPPPAAR